MVLESWTYSEILSLKDGKHHPLKMTSAMDSKLVGRNQPKTRKNDKIIVTFIKIAFQTSSYKRYRFDIANIEHYLGKRVKYMF